MPSHVTMTAYRVQATIILVLLGLFVVGTAVLFDRWVPAAAGAVLVGTAWGLSSHLGRTWWRKEEPMLVWAVGTWLLFASGLGFGAFPAPREWAALCVVGSFALVGAWAIHRDGGATEFVHPTSVVNSAAHTVHAILRPLLMTSAWVAGGVGIGMLAAVLGAPTHPLASVRSGVLLIGSLWGGVLGGAVIVGVLRPLLRWTLGTMLVGVAVATWLFAVLAAALHQAGYRAEAETLRQAVVLGLYMGVVIGPATALTFREGRRRAAGGASTQPAGS